MTSYEKIFKSFLRKVSDAELANRLEFNTELAIADMIEIRKLRRDYGYHHNSYIEEGNQT